MKNSKFHLLITIALLAAFAFWAARPSRPASSGAAGSSGTAAAARSASAFFSKAVRSPGGSDAAVQPFPAAAGGGAAALATAVTTPKAAAVAGSATANPLALAPPIPLTVAGPDQPIDFNRNYVLIGGHKAHPSRLLAKFAPQAGADGVTTALGAAQFAAFSAPLNRAGLVQLDSTSGAPTKVASATEAAKSGDAMQARIKALKASGQFEYVEPDYIVSVNTTPNDAAFADGRLWGLRNTGQSGGRAGADIGAERAWDLTTGSTNVIVAVIDTGIRYTHQDLATQMWRNPGEVGGNGQDDDNNGIVDDVFGFNAITLSGNPMDDNNHGTHCAGTIGAAANNGFGHVGVAWNVQLMACKFLDASGSGSLSHAIRCVDYAVAKRAKILSNSWGGGGYSQALYDAIRNARDQGVIFIAAAGNSAQNTDSSPAYPAGYELENVVSVAAIDRADSLASFSNYGRRTVHLGAPGVAIYSSVGSGDSAYDTYSGTSMATPHVAGVAALVAARQPELTLGELKQRLIGTTVPTAALADRTISGGRVNAYNAVSAAADGILEVSLAATPAPLLAGQPVVLTAAVSDLSPVTNATVTASIGGADLAFSNDGTAPDRAADDQFYTAQTTVPAGATNLTVILTVSAPGKTTAVLTNSFAVITPPANDRFADRAVLTGSNPTATGSNVAATGETGEPNHAGVSGRKSVWWTWTAPTSVLVTVSTAGSSFDTVLAAYTGTAVNALTQIAANDDFGGRLTSQITFSAVAGTAYQIAVDGYAGETGSIALALTALIAPANDAFADRIVLTGSNLTANGSNVAASGETGEPNHAGVSGRKSVWWSWTAPSNGAVTVSTAGSSYDTTLAAYTGSAVNALTLIAANDDFTGLTSQVSFSAVAGTQYQIAVDGYAGATGAIVLRVTPLVVPANDAFADRITLSGTNLTGRGSNTTATSEPGEPNHAGVSGGKSVWWSFTAAAGGPVVVSTAGSSYDTTLGVYTGTAVNGLTLIGANDDYSGLTSRVAFNATAGVTYQLAVDGYRGSSGSIVITVTATEAPPVITGQPASQTVTPGREVRFTVVATGSDLSYQWRYNGANLVDGSGVSGANTPTLTLVDPDIRVGGYSVVVSNRVASVTSTTATLLVTAAPVITTQPLSRVAMLRSSVSFSVVATGTGLSYQWQRNGVNLSNGGTIAGATSATLTLRNLTAAAAGDYAVTVRNSSGSVTSTNASLTILVPPAIVTQPVGRTVPLGTNVTFTVAATGSGPLAYQWYLDGGIISGATSPTLTLNNVTASQAGTYTVYVSGPGGQLTSNGARLSVITPPVITSQPIGRAVNPGTRVTFSVRVSGSGTLTYQWQRNGANVANGNGYSGATTATLTIASARANQTGQYTVVVANNAGSATSSPAPLTVNGRTAAELAAAANSTPAPAAEPTNAPSATAPVILTQPAALTLVRTNAGHITAATFTVTLSDATAAAYQWHWNGLALAGETHAVLRLADARRAQSGDYTVTVSNAHGSVTSRPAHLRVASPMQTYPALRAPDGRTVLYFRDVDGTAISAADVPAFRLWIAPSLSTPADQWQTVSEGFSASQGLLWFEDMGGRLATQPHYLLEEVTQP